MKKSKNDPRLKIGEQGEVGAHQSQVDENQLSLFNELEELENRKTGSAEIPASQMKKD